MVESDTYLLACCRYIERNPVRARIVADPDAYRWSSCRNRLGQGAEWLDYDPCYTALGNTTLERRTRYRQFLRSAIPDGEWDVIRESVQRGQLTGTHRFSEEVAAIIGRRIERRGRGRPVGSVNMTRPIGISEKETC